MDSIPGKIKVMSGLKRSRPPRDDTVGRGKHHVFRGGVIANVRRAPPGHTMFLAQAGNLPGVFERSGQRLVDEHRQARLEDRPRLLQVLSSVNALEQDGVDLRAESWDVIDDFHAEFVPQLIRVFAQPVAAGGDVRAASRIGCNDPGAGHVIRVRGVVENPGERGGVGRVQPDDADFDISGRDQAREEHQNTQQWLCHGPIVATHLSRFRCCSA